MMKRTQIYLDEETAMRLDNLAKANTSTRSFVIRQYIAEGLEREDSVAADLAAIDAAFGAVSDMPDLERSPGIRQAELDALFGEDPADVSA